MRRIPSDPRNHLKAAPIQVHLIRMEGSHIWEATQYDQIGFSSGLCEEELITRKVDNSGACILECSFWVRVSRLPRICPLNTDILQSWVQPRPSHRNTPSQKNRAYMGIHSLHLLECFRARKVFIANAIDARTTACSSGLAASSATTG